MKNSRIVRRCFLTTTMSSSRGLITVLTAELRRAGLTCARVARECGLAEPAREVAAASPPRRELRLQPERAMVADPRQPRVAIGTLSRWTPEPITDTCTRPIGMRAWLLAPFRALPSTPA